MKLKLIEFLLDKMELLTKRLAWIRIKEVQKEERKKFKEARKSLSKGIHVTTTGRRW